MNYNLMLSMRRRSVPAGTRTSTVSPTFLLRSACAIGDLTDIFKEYEGGTGSDVDSRTEEPHGGDEGADVEIAVEYPPCGDVGAEVVFDVVLVVLLRELSDGVGLTHLSLPFDKQALVLTVLPFRQLFGDLPSEHDGCRTPYVYKDLSADFSLLIKKS